MKPNPLLLIIGAVAGCLSVAPAMARGGFSGGHSFSGGHVSTSHVSSLGAHLSASSTSSATVAHINTPSAAPSSGYRSGVIGSAPRSSSSYYSVHSYNPPSQSSPFLSSMAGAVAGNMIANSLTRPTKTRYTAPNTVPATAQSAPPGQESTFWHVVNTVVVLILSGLIAGAVIAHVLRRRNDNRWNRL